MRCVTAGLNKWVCSEDFNDILKQSEKRGSRSVSAKSNYFLHSFLSDVGGLDLGLFGNPFNWCNRKGGRTNIHERLDRAVASPE